MMTSRIVPVLLVPLQIFLFASLVQAQERVTEITVVVATTGGRDCGTDANVFLGIGGLEFNLDDPDRNDFERNANNDFRLGPEGNNLFRLPESPMTFDDLLRFPAYIRVDDTDDMWCLGGIVVGVSLSTERSVTFVSPFTRPAGSDVIRLGGFFRGARRPQFLYLCRDVSTGRSSCSTF
jgi:hypothetical protein